MVLDAPEVGRNLQNHPAYSLRYACSQPVTAYKYLNPGAAIAMGLRYALTGGGSLAESYVATGGYMRSDPSLAVSDTIVVMIPALVTRRGDRVSPARPVPGAPRLYRDGGFRPAAQPRTYPAAQCRSDNAPADLPGIFLRARRSACPRALGAADARHDGGAAIRDLIEAELAPGPIANDQASIEADIRARCATYFHPSGTCRMGAEPTAVVDPQLRVNGIEGLRVVDASIMPAALNACTHAPTIMIGEKGAALIAGSP